MSNGPPDLEIRLERMTTAPHDAREAVKHLLDEDAESDFWQNALLATSEVVTHALTHGSGDACLSAWYSASTGWLRVEVAIGGAEMPSTDGVRSESGMDLLRLAVLLNVPEAWGIERTPFGRVVWFEVQHQPTER